MGIIIGFLGDTKSTYQVKRAPSSEDRTVMVVGGGLSFWGVGRWFSLVYVWCVVAGDTSNHYGVGVACLHHVSCGTQS